MPLSTTLPVRLRTRTVDVILDTMPIQPHTRAALNRVAPDAYGDAPVYLTDTTWLALGPGAKVDLLLLCRAEDIADRERAAHRRTAFMLVRKPEAS